MVRAADFGKLHDPACREDLDRPEIGRVLVQREMSTRLMVVGEVSGQDAAEVSLSEDEHVIQALAPAGPEQAVNRVELRAGRRPLGYGELLTEGEVLEAS